MTYFFHDLTLSAAVWLSACSSAHFGFLHHETSKAKKVLSLDKSWNFQGIGISCNGKNLDVI